jgi:hypothetical protein
MAKRKILLDNQRVILCGTLIRPFQNIHVELVKGIWTSRNGKEYPPMFVQEGNRYKVVRTTITKYYPLITMRSRHVADEARKKLYGFTQNENPDCNMVKPSNMVLRGKKRIKEIYIIGL